MMLSYLNPLQSHYIEELSKQYLDDPTQLDPSWKFFFDGLSLKTFSDEQEKHKKFSFNEEVLQFEIKVLKLIQSYRELGYLVADVNPLDREIKFHPLLHLSSFNLSEEDLNRPTLSGHHLGLGEVPLREVLNKLKKHYCSPIGIEYGHIEDPESRLWLESRVESEELFEPLSADWKKRILLKLTEAELLETFLHKRFVGQKRFSLEGLDAIIPLLDILIEQASQRGADEMVLGMAHRGRVNVLVNTFKKDVKKLFAEFAGNIDATVGDGDVKYHMGYSQDILTLNSHSFHLSLMPNPSHLEAINPVLLGATHAKQKMKNDYEKIRSIPVLLHGDASFAGQGIVYETLNMSALPAYSVGGTIHVITNNQVGFTAVPKEARSTPNSTDIAKMLEIPIFRVNADEIEAVYRVVCLALDFRSQFKRDVVIDLVGYRRHGHNEGDEPSFTQPLMYQNINRHPRVRAIYEKHLIEEGVVSAEESQNLYRSYEQKLDQALSEAKESKVSPMMESFGDRWQKLKKIQEENVFKKYQTQISKEQFKNLGEDFCSVPKDFQAHPKLLKIIEDRRKMISGEKPVDWAVAEALAFASLVEEGFPVRLVGQDSERGTFSHRHCVWHDIQNGKKYNSINTIKNKKAYFEVHNSLLSEYGALGFEFGQSLASPQQLTIWEAQFGDFVNGAQIVIDQFITASVAKWNRYSGLVLLLPHGYEGQGPEHSSARPERFLQACAQYNIQVCDFSTPAQYFHALRRQVLRDFRMPLVVLAPKSLLRHPKVVSPLEAFCDEVFQEVIDDENVLLKQEATRVILCSSKVYYELKEERDKNEAASKIALIRLEQFYPFPKELLSKILKSYTKLKELVWCQENPKNMGAWTFLSPYLNSLLEKDQSLIYVGRVEQASPADGYLVLHQNEQAKIIKKALNSN